MDGLTNIIAKIHEQSDAECASIVSSAENKAKEILDGARVAATEVTSKIQTETDSKINLIKTKSVSSAEIEYKRAILSKKSELINDVVASCIESIKNCETEKYFGFIEKLVLKNALNGKGILHLCAKDVERLPDSFAEKINGMLGEGKSIELSNEPLAIDGGFVVEYPEIRIDCSFESLLEDAIDEIRDELGKLLFS